MNKWVRLEGDIVKELLPRAATVPSVAHWYGEGFAAQCVQAPDAVQCGWVYDPETDSFSEPPVQQMPDTSPEPDYAAFAAGLLEGYIQ